jgi:hypothetical protein
VISFFGVWIGTATANEFKGWRTVILPLVYIVTIIVTIYFLIAVVEGTALTIEGLGQSLGLSD